MIKRYFQVSQKTFLIKYIYHIEAKTQFNMDYRYILYSVPKILIVIQSKHANQLTINLLDKRYSYVTYAPPIMAEVKQFC